MSEASALLRRIKRLESQLEETRAERDLYHMMTFDLASPSLITAIEKRYPALVAKWRQPA